MEALLFFFFFNFCTEFVLKKNISWKNIRNKIIRNYRFTEKTDNEVISVDDDNGKIIINDGWRT